MTLMRLQKIRITYSGVASTAALVIALSTGGAYAADLIGTKKIAKGAVTTPKIHKGAVTTAKIHKGAVGTAKIKNGAVGTKKLKNGAVTTDKLADGTLTAIIDAAITGFKLADGAVTTDKLGNGAVTASKLSDGAVTSSKLGNGAVTSTAIIDAAITGFKLADGAVTTAKLADGSVTTAKLDDGTRADIVPPWGTIPSGKTVVGEISYDGTSGAARDWVRITINLPAAAPQPFEEVAYGVSMPGIATRDAEHCAGDVTYPRPAPGYFCLYPYSAYGYDQIIAAPTTLWDETRAVNLRLREAAANADNYYDIIWAYTAP